MGKSIPMGSEAQELEQLYRAHARRVRWVVRARGVPEHAVDDVVHDAFLTIYQRMADRDPAVSTAAWVVGVARNVAFSHRRSAARRTLRTSELPEPRPGPTPHDELERRDAWHALRLFLDGLDEEQREAFIMCEVMQTPVAEVAAATKVKLNTVYSRVRLARQRFDAHFSGEDTRGVLRVAVKQERPASAQHRHALAALALDLGVALPQATAVVVGTGLTAAWKIAIVASAAGVASLGAIKVATSPAPAGAAGHAAPIQRPATGIGESSDAKQAQLVPERPTLPAPDPVREVAVTQQSPGEPPSEGVVRAIAPDAVGTRRDALTREVQLLAQARDHLSQGRPNKALAAVDAYAAAFPNGSLARQRNAIERDAACKTGDLARAERATRALGGTAEPAGCLAAEKIDAPVTDASVGGAR